jgi:hypothetical protein
MAKMTYKEFVKMHMKDVSGSPKEKMSKIAMMWSTYKTKGGYLESDADWKAERIKSGDIKEGQTEAKSFKDLLDIPSAAKAPPPPKDGFDQQATMEQVAKYDKQQAAKQKTTKNIWAPYKAPIVMPVPDGYPWFLFQHPNKFSANPNQVLVSDTQARFMRSSIYDNLKGKLKYIPAKTSGYGANNPDANIQPHKDFRIIFRFQRPDNDKYVYDATDADDYMRVLDMSKDSGFIYPTEVLAKQFTDNNAQLAEALSKEGQATVEQQQIIAENAWNSGAQATQDSWEQSVSKAETEAQAQEEYFNTLKEQEAAREREANKKSGWDQFLDIAGDVATVAAKVLI